MILLCVIILLGSSHHPHFTLYLVPEQSAYPVLLVCVVETWSSQHYRVVQTMDTKAQVIFDTQFNVFLGLCDDEY